MRFCSALLDSGATPQRVRELCLSLYGVDISEDTIREFSDLVIKFAKFRTDDSLVVESS
jgi:hypothetical protein